MKTMRLKFESSGTAADGQTWSVAGEVESEDTLDFSKLCDKAGIAAFTLLTQGKAEYGKPGVGCRGPYKIDKFSWERIG